MDVIAHILISILFISVVSLAGILSFIVKGKFFDRILFIIIAFAAGGMLGAAFLDLLPEALEKGGFNLNVWSYALLGILIFFILERFIFWRHCHNGKCDAHVFTYLNLMGDGIHNFIDGMIVAASFLTSIHLGIVTTLAIVSHETPQEIGDFGILVYGGFSKSKALLYNFLSALTSFAGALSAYFLSSYTEHFITFLLAFAAGGFIYIASTDLMPELHKEIDRKRSFVQLISLIAGAAIVLVMNIAE